MVDIGQYNKEPALYGKLVEELYQRYPDGVTLPPEYADFVQNNTLQILIRLARYKFVARLIKKSDRLLEVGSGSGLGAMFLAQHCAHVTGLELKVTEVEEAKTINKRDNVAFVCANLFDYQPEHRFDVVVCLDVIEHLVKEEGVRLVQTMASLLKPSGMLVVGSPSIHSYPYQGPLSQASHVHCYDQPELLALVDTYCTRTLAFSMNDETVHTGFHKLAWYYIVLGFSSKI
ncbi:MAG: methyltransferase domain-containing protein [Magnetococcales bacterium]|nr:methyltransferase domain-containing protein [Magnetococcales bacterium]